MKYTEEDLRKIIKEVGNSPLDLGIVIMKSLGYDIQRYSSGTVYVYDKDGDLIYWG